MKLGSALILSQNPVFEISPSKMGIMLPLDVFYFRRVAVGMAGGFIVF